MPETIQPHILVVDDDPQIRDLLEEYLAQNELRVSVASTGKEMSAILGSEVVATPKDNSNGKTECIYQSGKPITHSMPYADLSVDWGEGETAMNAAGFMNKREPGIANPYAGIGDEAVMVGPTLMIKTGNDFMQIILSDVSDVPGTAKKIFNTAKPRM